MHYDINQRKEKIGDQNKRVCPHTIHHFKIKDFMTCNILFSLHIQHMITIQFKFTFCDRLKQKINLLPRHLS